MARIPEITKREDVAPDKQHIFDEVLKTRGGVGGPFSVMLNSPEICGRVTHVGTYLRFESPLPATTRELAIIETAKHWDCAVEYAGHSRLAEKVGVPKETLAVVDKTSDPSKLPADDANLIRYVRELLDKRRISAPVFDAVHRKYGNQGITEITAVIGYYSNLACFLNAFEVKPGTGGA